MTLRHDRLDHRDDVAFGVLDASITAHVRDVHDHNRFAAGLLDLVDSCIGVIDGDNEDRRARFMSPPLMKALSCGIPLSSVGPVWTSTWLPISDPS